MHKRTAIGAAAFSVALAGGAAAGALLGTPAVSGAQDESTTTTASDDTEAGRLERPLKAHHGERLAAAAEALGMTQDELVAELRAGRSIAQVAEERDVDLDTVVGALVAEGTEQLEAAIEALPERMAELVEREGLGRGRGHGRGPGHPGLRDGPRGPAAEAEDDAAS